MATAAKRDGGKSEFVRAALEKNPKANPRTVNEAWKSAGHSGVISNSLVHKMRANMGVTGNLRARSKRRGSNGAAKKAPVEGRRRGRPPKVATLAALAANGAGSAGAAKKALSPGGRARMLELLEAEVDQLLFRTMALGGLAEVEDALRRARRLLVLAHRG
jgi:hypothetical protein